MKQWKPAVREGTAGLIERNTRLIIATALVLIIACVTWIVLSVSFAWVSDAHAGQSMQVQDVIEVDGSHIRRIYDPTHSVACYLVRWPAANAPDLACVKVEGAR